ncbi:MULTISPECIES: DUF2283 domain-containing protein [unclassified Synechocystis]|uniref:DUF2283 domain-containing protein n=1 Tax=unclassified Synechocystis TaxID=2640012 RepID=UPI000409E22D|nr:MULTISPECIES: DUF2283 domain-containing protein [unclassified Synechocystis]AIE74145.1 hypothetical protein D082_16170 [Synechocystis sp. PCC 6714]MCT0252784.1 DUF2283 domain-containing protein [Synechocystis sp. CS-94]
MNNIEYDPEVDSAYFRVADQPGIDSEEITDGIIVDYDQDDNVVAIELLGVQTINPNDFQKLESLIPQSALAQLQEWLPKLAIAISC